MTVITTGIRQTVETPANLIGTTIGDMSHFW